MANIGYLNGTGSSVQTDVEFTNVDFQQITNTSVTTTNSGRTVRTTNSTTIWAGTLNLTVYTQSAFKSIQSFFAKARGQLNDFFVTIPGVSDFTGTKSGTPVLALTSDTAQGSTSASVATDAGAVNLKAGDVIQFASHNKVYMLTDNASVSNIGSTQINFTPPLVEDANRDSAFEGAAVQYDEIYFQVIAATDSIQYQYNLDGTVSFSIEIREVI